MQAWNFFDEETTSCLASGDVVLVVNGGTSKSLHDDLTHLFINGDKHATVFN